MWCCYVENPQVETPEAAVDETDTAVGVYQFSGLVPISPQELHFYDGWPPRETKLVPMPDHLIRVDSDQSLDLYTQSCVQNAAVRRYYKPQSEDHTCSLATISMTMNSLGVVASETSVHKVCSTDLFKDGEFQLPTLTAKSYRGLDPQLILDEEYRLISSIWCPVVLGVTNIAVTCKLMGADARISFGYGAEYQGADDDLSFDDTCANFRKDLKMLEDGACTIIASFDRLPLGMPGIGKGMGHYSPVGAFNTEKDAILIHDTAAKYGQYWAPLKLMVEAVRTRNSNGGSRGWIVVSAKK